MSVVSLPGTKIKIEVTNTSHGPEIAVMDGHGCTTVTIFEFEKFLIEAASLVRTARAMSSARASMSALPMRKP